MGWDNYPHSYSSGDSYDHHSDCHYTDLTSTITPPSVTVPAPSGFVGVNDDPDNWEIFVPPDDGPWWWDSDRKRRSAEPEPEPKPEPVAGKYVTAITCTKTYLTKTGTSDIWKTTTKPGATITKTLVMSTKTVLLPILTVTKTTTKITRITSTAPHVFFPSSIFTKTLTAYTDTTTYLTAVTSNLPSPTYYESCGPRNRSPSPGIEFWTAYHIGSDPDGDVHVIFNNGTSHDCCAACHTYSQGGVCIGSVYHALTSWGEQKCVEPPLGHSPCPEFSAKCELIIATSDAPGQCRQRQYSLTQDNPEGLAIVSDGLSCKRFKFSGWLTPAD
ncbi:hypothetical protein TWF694_010020 [Orbilia ellipsospora]|uniref:Uncharacterized protein n=1 Tax=Orbilia ellipsospora TaxID=2528407 RepID=A0AAV9X8M5_9PEZI